MHYNFFKKIALGVVCKTPPSMGKDSGFSTQSCLKMSTLQSKIFSSFVSYKNLSDRERYVIKVWRYTRNLTTYLRALNLEVVLLFKMILL